MKERKILSKEKAGFKEFPQTRDFESELLTEIKSQIYERIGIDDNITIAKAPDQTGMDYGIQLSSIAKRLNTNPVELSRDIANHLAANVAGLPVEAAISQGPYLNLRIEMSMFAPLVIEQILRMGKDYGRENLGKGQKVVFDMSSPNIAKRMSYGHLRSTIIGEALSNLYQFEGYETVRDNHIGDWGTQFGKLIVAIKNWGNEPKLLAADDPIGELQTLYVKFHEQAEKEKEHLRDGLILKAQQQGKESVPGLIETINDITRNIIQKKGISLAEVDQVKVFQDAIDRLAEPNLEKEGREWFLRLEKGDPEARRLWQICVELSLKEFDQIYQILRVKFDVSLGESFYEDKMAPVIKEAKKKKIGQISNGALVVKMNDKNLGVAIIQKSDGASVYMTRDLACAIYREKKMRSHKAIYVVGEDQKLYFQQLFEILRRLGYQIGNESEHIYFGMVRLPEGKMSTRKGRTILLKDVISEGLKRATEIISVKNPVLSTDERKRLEITRQIAVGALKWNDLSQDPRHSIVFDWDKALNFEGFAAPYVQYAAVRAKSILKSAIANPPELSTTDNSLQTFREPSERNLVKTLAQFPGKVKEATQQNSPFKLATYIYELARAFNTFYVSVPVLKSPNAEIVASRLQLTAASLQVIENGLSLLGIEIPEEM